MPRMHLVMDFWVNSQDFFPSVEGEPGEHGNHYLVGMSSAFEDDPDGFMQTLVTGEDVLANAQLSVEIVDWYGK